MYIGHSALRMYAMGRRGLEERASEDDLRRMAAAVEEAIRVGALGFSTSRATTHTTPDGSPLEMEGTYADVLRRQNDGTWKFIIDNPRGTD